MLLVISIALSALAIAQDSTAFEKLAEHQAADALKGRDSEARLLVCNFSRLSKERAFTCYSKDLGPGAACDDGSRSAPFYIVEGYVDENEQPRIGKIVFSEACEGVQG